MRWSTDPTTRRRAFTVVEVMIAGVITAFVLGSVSMSISQLGRAKSVSKMRFDAYHRADVALTAIRHDLISIIRADDLFYTRLLLMDDSERTGIDEPYEVARDEILIFSNRLREIHPSDYSGEGIEYETQYRIEEDETGFILWRRRDAVPEEFPLGGGMATPLVEGIVGLSIEVYDGDEWEEVWESDDEGLPLAVQVMVTASGHRAGEDPYDAPFAVLRTIIPIDRVIPPKDIFKADEEAAELEEQMAEEEAAIEQAEELQELFDGQRLPPEGVSEIEIRGPDGSREIRQRGGTRDGGVRELPGGGGGGGGGGQSGSQGSGSPGQGTTNRGGS
ncbi:MAG: hypothetical protein JSV91_11180 [Phycisphaerales bacterium]|nr:MAG: hypothetical protein JSV91_11180 [Phycisphaerales bacterium]